MNPRVRALPCGCTVEYLASNPMQASPVLCNLHWAAPELLVALRAMMARFGADWFEDGVERITTILIGREEKAATALARAILAKVAKDQTS